MTDYTPAPWKIVTPGQHGNPPPEANFLIEFGPGDFGGFWVVRHHGVGNLLANAYLIAAAPDLLEALERIDELATTMGQPGVGSAESLYFKDIARTARAAIAKAEGK